MTKNKQNISIDQNNKQNSKRVNPAKIFIWASVGVCIICVIFICMMKWCLPYPNWNMMKRGQLGDMFGVLGALFSGLAFAGVIVAMIQQNEELGIQREDLTQQRNEMINQNKTMGLQRFENTFFNMIELHLKIVEDQYFVCRGHEYNGRDVFRALHDELRRVTVEHTTSVEVEDGTTNKIPLSTYLHYYHSIQNSNLNRYFLHLYRLLRFIDDSIVIGNEEKFNYSNLLRAQLSRYELEMLFYQGLYMFRKDDIKPLIEKYGLLYYLQSDVPSDFSRLLHANYKGSAFEYDPQINNGESTGTNDAYV